MNKIAIIGAGVSGLTVARLMQAKGHSVVVFERESTVGGLIRCQRVNGSLFHICGGHVFNSKRQDVLDWFWNYFDKTSEFHLADRKSVVWMQDGLVVPYPIEDHVYYFNDDIQKRFAHDLDTIERLTSVTPNNFEEFLRMRFGETLYRLYFEPYNRKVWRRDLSQVPLSWLEGKLPMPTVEQIRYNNQHHVEEKQFVHSTFYYENNGGSQFLADRLAEGLDIRCNTNIDEIELRSSGILVNGEQFDKLVFCGNIKQLIPLLSAIKDLKRYQSPVNQLESHGTTAVFCELDTNPYTWIYQPSAAHMSHRIICTGNFAPSNNAEGKMTGTVEFTDEISESEIREQLSRMPLHPRYLTHHYNPYTYPIQDNNTRALIRDIKKVLASYSIYLTGRFADWEYYNMDAAMGAAIDLCSTFTE